MSGEKFDSISNCGSQFWFGITGSPCFLKVHFIPLPFYKRPTLVPVFTNWKKSKEDFCFYKKRWKWKQHSVFVFQATVTEASRPWAGQGDLPDSFPGNYTASQHQVPIALNCVCEHLCFIWVRSVHPFSRCVLRSSRLRFMPFQLMKGFIEATPYIWIAKIFFWLNGFAKRI